MIVSDKFMSFLFFRIVGGLLAILSFFALNIHCQTVQGNAIAWLDGDTIQFRQTNGKVYKVRLLGIDAPEMKQDYGRECKDLLKSRTQSKPLTLQIVEVDLYKRSLAYASTPQIADVNLFMLESGCAWERWTPIEKRTAYQTAEATAQNNHVGLWADEFALPPWQFRQQLANRCQ